MDADSAVTFSDDQIKKLLTIFGTSKFFSWYCEDGGDFNEWIQDSDVEIDIHNSLASMLNSN